MQLQKGQKVKFSDLYMGSEFKVECLIESTLNIDVSCFGLNDNNKLEDENYMVFYNQRASAKNEIIYQQNNNTSIFKINTSGLPHNASRLVFTAAIDGAQTMQEIESLEFTLGSASFKLTGQDFLQEKAIIIAEIYKKDDVWRLSAVGQGFKGGLDTLLLSFGGTIADNKKQTFLEKRVRLEKTMEKEAPQLVSLAKKAAVSLEKRGLGEHRARVALCLDISISMNGLYRNGLVQEFVERILALGCRLDDDGSIDIFLFGANGYQPAPISIKDFNGYVERTIRSHPLEGDTRYATAIELVRKHYTQYQYERSEAFSQETPIYIMFLTDGKPSDKAQATRALKNSSFEPIFWKFMGVGDEDFSYLEKLDDLTNRFIDNADFFRVSNLKSISDDQLYEKLINEYPEWLSAAKAKKLIHDLK